jgi:hypothetical protein
MDHKQRIIDSLTPIVSERGYLPSRQELEKDGLGWLSSGIQRNGGFTFFQKALNTGSKKPSKKRSNEECEAELLGVAASIGRMPSNSYLLQSGMSWLSNWIARNGGFVEVAARLNLQREHSDSDTGWQGEKEVQAILECNGFEVQRSQQVKSPFDLLIDGVVKVDVKTSSLTTRQNSQSGGSVTGWFYRIGKMPQADIVALFCMDSKDIFLIPWNQLPHTNVTLSQGGGKYRKYMNNFAALRRLCELRSKESCIWQ